MAYSVESNTRTPITLLREALDKAERLIVQVDGSNVVELLNLLDHIDAQFEVLEGQSDLRSEQSRWDGLISRVSTRPDPIVHAANVAGGLPKLRGENPPATNFWWRLDEEVTRRRVGNLRRLITTIVAVVVLAVGGYYAINYFFPPNPEAVLMVETNNALDRLIVEQRWEEALELIQAARAQSPANVELMVWEAVIYERMGNADAAAAALAEANAALPDDPVQVLIYLGNSRLRAGDVAGAKAAGEEALALAPNEAQVYFLLGGVAETEGELATAITYFDQTYQLAEGSAPQLAVIARVRMGQLMQNPGSFGSPAATPSPVP
jgi:tetratricopeptide (TPR) repeat protein